MSETNRAGPLVAMRILAGFPTRKSLGGLSEVTVWRIETTNDSVRASTLQRYAAAVRAPVEAVRRLRPGGDGVSRLIVLDQSTWRELAEAVPPRRVNRLEELVALLLEQSTKPKEEEACEERS